MTTAGPRPLDVTPGGDYTAVIEVAREPDGSFRWTNLNIAAGTVVGPGISRPAPSPSLTGGFAAVGWGTDRRRVYYADTDGAIIEIGTTGHGWEYRNFTADFGVRVARWNSPLATGGMRGQWMNVYYADERGRLVVMKFHSGDWNFGGNPRLPKVAEKSPLTALQNGRGRFAYYFDDRDHIIEVEERGVSGQVTDLTNYASLPHASPLSGLSAVGWGYDHRRVYYTDRQDNLIEVVGFGDDGGMWSHTLPCKSGVSQPERGSPLAAAVGPETLAGVALWNETAEPVWASRDGGWWSREIPTTVAANSSVASTVTGDGQPWVSYVDKDNHLSLWRGLQEDWQWWDLTANLHLPAAATVATQGPLALVHTERGPRLYYLTDEPQF
ncbi:hypothetical protein ACWEQL_06975 [Kitasatospora sp. NPDC004240]